MWSSTGGRLSRSGGTGQGRSVCLLRLLRGSRLNQDVAFLAVSCRRSLLPGVESDLAVEITIGLENGTLGAEAGEIMVAWGAPFWEG